MQTFLPYPSFTHSLACLDNKRLGKQRVEAKQILMALEFGPYQYRHSIEHPWISCIESAFLGLRELNPKCVRRTPWYNHPATKMWRGYEGVLAEYGYICCQTWIARGFKDTLMPWFEPRIPLTPVMSCSDPSWLSNNAFHLSHQSNLVRKDPVYYRQFFPYVPDNLPYVWPTP